jgi:CheY-like chemotaxis protein
MTGYRGRFSILEILKISKELERLIGKGATADKLADQAMAEGMRTLWDSGMAHLLRGESTIEELLRVVDMPQDDELPGGETDVAAPEPDRRRSGSFSGGTTPVGVAPTAGPGVQPRRMTDQFELVDGATAVKESGDGSVDIRVLLVDDEDQLRRVMKDLLERDGYTVFEAGDGAQAIEQVDIHVPDILVLDLNLPGLDGYGVITQLRSRQTTQHIPIIVLTAKGDEDNEVRVFELGADDFLSKPFRARALSARIQAVLARSRPR